MEGERIDTIINQRGIINIEEDVNLIERMIG